MASAGMGGMVVSHACTMAASRSGAMGGQVGALAFVALQVEEVVVPIHTQVLSGPVAHGALDWALDPLQCTASEAQRVEVVNC